MKRHSDEKAWPDDRLWHSCIAERAALAEDLSGLGTEPHPGLPR